jgi:N-succinyldiaminopimelate aminotransferase
MTQMSASTAHQVTEAAAARGRYAQRTSALEPLELAELLYLGRRSGAVDLALGTPSYPDTGADLIGHACDALRGGANQYADPAGNAMLREAAAAQHSADPDTEITVTAGATEGLNVVLQSLVQPGDEVVVIEPFFETYAGAVALTGAQPRFVRLHGPDWRWEDAELAGAFGPRTRAVVVNSPHNPTGRVLTRAEYEQLGSLCQTWDAILVSDEVYAELVAAPGPVFPWQIAALAGRTVALRSLSKSHAVSGWRIGWIYAPAMLTKVFRMVHAVLTVGCAAPLQTAAARTLRERPSWSAQERERLAGKRQAIVAALNAAGWDCPMPEGSAFALAALPAGCSQPARDIARRLTVETGVVAAPGELFFSSPSAGARYVRFAYNKADPVIELGVRRLARSRDVLASRPRPGVPAATPPLRSDSDGGIPDAASQ